MSTRAAGGAAAAAVSYFVEAQLLFKLGDYMYGDKVVVCPDRGNFFFHTYESAVATARLFAPGVLVHLTEAAFVARLRAALVLERAIVPFTETPEGLARHLDLDWGNSLS